MLSSNKQEAQKTAIRMLNFRAYSEGEIREKLNARGFASDEIDEVIHYLNDRGYLDDVALCNNLVDTYCKSNKYSFRMIVIKLKQRGIAEMIIHEALRYYDCSLESIAALKIIDKRFKQFDPSEKVKICRYLARRGFSAITISNVTRNLE
jgi:Uncharacterized protein conserved in bacteria